MDVKINVLYRVNLNINLVYISVICGFVLVELGINKCGYIGLI